MLASQCLMYAKFSPGAGGRVGYVLHNNIYVQVNDLQLHCMWRATTR